jgi:hypothetical protein
MNLSMPSKVFSVIALLGVAALRAEEIAARKVVGLLIAAEKAYAKLAGEKGFREASLSVFADDAVIFAPTAVNGKSFGEKLKEFRHNGVGAPSRRGPTDPVRERALSITSSESRAESIPPASQDSRYLRDTLAGILQKSSRAGCCKIHRRSASVRASKPPP